MHARCFCISVTLRSFTRTFSGRNLSTAPEINKSHGKIELLGRKFTTDDWTNVTPKIISKLGCNLHVTKNHPLSHVRQQIVNYFYKAYRGRTGNPLFSVYDNLHPVVTVEQNFDSLLVPPDHPSRNKSDCYYVNQETLLRAHTTAHQAELISSGLNNFLIVGDVYRRDEIDSTHYPVFHQVDAVRLCTRDEIFENVKDSHRLHVFEQKGIESPENQACHTLESVKLMEHDLKTALVGLAQELFGKKVKYRWVNQYFPFTHPSWELEVFYNDKWLEVLGCGIIRQEILHKAGVLDRIGWAFGLGLERLAMCLYSIPDIRLFWSKDSGFLHQFITEDVYKHITYKPVSVYPPCSNDISFWLPQEKTYCSNDFYDIVRDIGGDTVEQILLIDEFVHPKTKKTSHCYRIVYRHMERVLTQEEVSEIHKNIQKAVEKHLDVMIRM
ncbi:probable phenylalanine--tRNA ligase, mitochondrial [Copidosoma floridanum]|uniref:probable phenylalanine--tRNA ligase, mitochondrial n=1 Tax=Copidosoma floridanum TaxID=29053 RepID=UPI0006C99E1E|nr:probable phenylalanine--tRNA ligase, mitochondrial [Copidosoma floridanum]